MPTLLRDFLGSGLRSGHAADLADHGMENKSLWMLSALMASSRAALACGGQEPHHRSVPPTHPMVEPHSGDEGGTELCHCDYPE